MDVGKAFSYMFEDEDWITKLAIGGLFVLLSPVLIGIPFLLGYMVEAVENVMRDDPRPLPSWSNPGDKFVKGLVLAAICLIYMLPVIFLACLQSIASISAGDRAGEGMVAFALCIQCLSALWGFLVAIVLPAVIIRYAQSGEFSDGFRFHEIFALISANLSDYIVAILVGWLASIVAGFGIILCFIGVVFTTFWSYLVAAHLWGQIGRRASSAGIVSSPAS